MTILQAIILGAVQGATEFIPVSSSGHLILVPWMLGWDPSTMAFDLATHVGTLVALVWFFWRDWVAILSSLGRMLVSPKKVDSYTRLQGTIGIWIALACIPAAVIGVVFGDAIEENLRHPLFVASTISSVAILMLLVDHLGRKERSWGGAKLADWMVIGTAQALALMPGVSRSGITITAGLAMGLTREAAARCSFLLSLPITAGASALVIGKAFRAGLSEGELQAFVVAAISSAIVGYLCIKFLLNFLQKRGLAVFCYYRLVLAALIAGLYFYRGA